MTTSVSEDRTALVTGASSGIGAELTRQIAGDGYDLVITARREHRLSEIAREVEEDHGVAATVIPKDLADPDSPQELFEEVQEQGIDVHTLVNNAGYPVYGRFDKTPIEEDLDMIQVNLVALTHLTKLFVRPMIERGDGKILNVGAGGGFFPLPRLASYGATKAYVLSFSEAIAHELADEGIQVTVLCPGSVDTEVWEKSEVGETGLADESSMSDPTSVAEAGWNGLKAGKRIIRPSMQAKLYTQLPRILPRSKMTAMAASGTEKTSE